MLIMRSQSDCKRMKNNQPFNLLSPQTQKYVPTPEGATLILNYFVYNNFQDFNTWQQIARTKVEYDYFENQKGGFGCKIVLKWEERTIPTLIESAEAKSKRSAKKRALKKLIETIINQGYIAHGFKEDNFVEKLPRRRKNSSDQSEEDHEEQRFPQKSALLTLLRSGQYDEVFQVLARENPKWKIWQLLECWKHGLSIKSLQFCRKVIKAYRGENVTFSGMECETDKFFIWAKGGVTVRQFSYGKLVNDPLSEELTDFIRYQQLQKSFTSRHGTIRQAALQIRAIPSQNILKEMKNPVPTRQQLTSYFHPIEGRKIFLSSLEKRQSFFHQAPMQIDLPKFESEEREFTMKMVEGMYGLLPYYCLDYGFLEQVAGMMREQIKIVEMVLGQNEVKYQEKGIAYYLNFKNLLTAQFCYLLNGRLNSNMISVQGMVTPFKQQDQVFLFSCRQPQEILNKKLNRRGNFNEFEQMQEISINEYVALISTLDRKVIYIGQVLEFAPNIKIYIPQLSEDLSDPEPLTMVKIYNSKIFEKTSSSIVKAARSCMRLIEENTTIIWQPPSFPVLSVLAQLLVEWQTIKSTVLIVSLDAEALQVELTAQGFKVVRVTPKTEEKLLAKCSIVIAQPAAVCCQLLRNYAFSRVIIENAHQISEVSILHSLVKGCKELFLIGDPFMPRMEVSSPYCLDKSMNISLIERLYGEGHKTETYFSRFENCCEYRNVMEWADKFLYSGKLMLFGNENQTPIIKGFPWPSLDYRICFLQMPSKGEETDCLERQSYLCSAICAQVVKSGYTKIQQITCSAAVGKLIPFLQKRIGVLLRMLGYNEPKLFTKHMSRLCRVVTGSVYSRCDLSIMMLGNERGLSFRELLGAMREGRRGVIIIGDMDLLKANPDYTNFLDWCKQKKLINSVDLNIFPHLS